MASFSAPGAPGQYLYVTVTQREMALLLPNPAHTEPPPFPGVLCNGVSGISRPSNAAWLVCENHNMYVNLGQ